MTDSSGNPPHNQSPVNRTDSGWQAEQNVPPAGQNVVPQPPAPAQPQWPSQPQPWPGQPGAGPSQAWQGQPGWQGQPQWQGQPGGYQQQPGWQGQPGYENQAGWQGQPHAGQWGPQPGAQGYPGQGYPGQGYYGQAQPQGSDQTMVMVVYGLYLGGFLIPFLPIVAVVLAYVNRGAAPPWQQTHFTYQIRTFWIGLLFAVIGFISLFIVIGIFVLLAAAVWQVVRVVRGMIAASNRQPIPNPETWLI